MLKFGELETTGLRNNLNNLFTEFTSLKPLNVSLID